jgi:hypothetical protein
MLSHTHHDHACGRLAMASQQGARMPKMRAATSLIYLTRFESLVCFSAEEEPPRSVIMNGKEVKAGYAFPVPFGVSTFTSIEYYTVRCPYENPSTTPS